MCTLGRLLVRSDGPMHGYCKAMSTADLMSMKMDSTGYCGDEAMDGSCRITFDPQAPVKSLSIRISS